MMMKPIVLFAVLATTIVVSAQSVEPYRVELLDPRGFRVLRSGEGSLHNVTLESVVISGPTRGIDDGILNKSLSRRGDGSWVYENTTATLNPGDTVFLVARENAVQENSSSPPVRALELHVPIDAPRVAATQEH